MGFIGVQPASVPLTASDITDGIISKSKIANDAVDNTKLDLTDDYAFTGTITGAGGGKIGQVIQAISTNQTFITSTSLADTNLSASITPTATSSKVLVMISQICLVDRDNQDGFIKYKLVRGSTDIHEWTYIWRVEAGGASAVKSGGFTTLMYLDSPSTTSSVTYKTQGAISDTSNNGAARFQQGSKQSYIQLLEVLA